jgi:drug/metabolite transporter (DMT)-like permease
MSATTAAQRTSPWMIGACLMAVYVIWGTTYFAIKVGIAEVAPFFLVGTRFVVAGGALMLAQMLRAQRMPTLKQWRNAALLGFLLLVAGNGGVAVAERWVSSGATVALISVTPLATALWSGALGQWPRRWEWLAIGLGAVGAAVMLMGRDLHGSLPGTALILCAATCWSLGTVLSRRLDLPHGPTGFGAEMLSAGIIALLVSAALGEHWAVPSESKFWWSWGYLVVFGSLIAFSAYRYVVERVSPTLAATYAYVNPPVALFVGWWLGNESFSSNVLVGLPIVLGAVALHAWIQTPSFAAALESVAPGDAVSPPREASDRPSRAG